MFGGGATTGSSDVQFPIRETAIRGHLRHWWRETVGYKLGSRMWQREEETFGSPEFPSPLIVRIPKQPQIDLIDSSEIRDKLSPVAYALFSAMENKQSFVAEGMSFLLHLSWDNAKGLRRRRQAQNEQRNKARKPLLPDTIDDIGDDIRLAFRAWVAFGGLGARTRRGCGAVHCHTQTSNPPAIPARGFIGSAKPNALDAWKAAVQAYRDFRQTPRGGLHSKTIDTRNGPKTIQVPGRSHWPEADSIRQITGCALRPGAGTSSSGVPNDQDTRDHSVPVIPPASLPSFPKAILGLPINYHFAADGPAKNQPGQANKDPQAVQLVPLLPTPLGDLEKADRLASPVITRPLWLNEKWYPAIVIMNRELPNGFQVRLEGKGAMAGGRHLSRDVPMNRVVDASLGVLRPMRGRSSAIEALIKFLTEAGFKPWLL